MYLIADWLLPTSASMLAPLGHVRLALIIASPVSLKLSASLVRLLSTIMLIRHVNLPAQLMAMSVRPSAVNSSAIYALVMGFA